MGICEFLEVAFNILLLSLIAYVVPVPLALTCRLWLTKTANKWIKNIYSPREGNGFMLIPTVLVASQLPVGVPHSHSLVKLIRLQPKRNFSFISFYKQVKITCI